MSGPRHLFLIDGSGFLFRAFHALPPLTRSDGTPVGAVYGFIQMILKLIEDTDADAIAVVFDAARETFRNEIYPAYKANRPEPPDDLIPQFALVREATKAFNLPALELRGFEADDLIATYARMGKEAGADVTIVSADKDLMQLVGGKVRMLDPIKARSIGPDEVREKFGVPPEKVVDVQALAGDSTDNVPGVPGIGVKTAAELINQYGDLDTVLARADEIKQPKRREALKENADKARLSRELVRLKDDVPVPVPLDALTKRKIEPEVLLHFLREQEFKKLIARIEARFAAEGVTGLAAPAGRPEAAAGKAVYELVQTADALESWVEGARAVGIVAVDTETTSLDATRAELVGVSLAFEPGHACYIPLAHREPEAQANLGLGDDPGAKKDPAARLKQIPRDRALAILKPLLRDETVLKVGHNIKYDMLMLSRYGVTVDPIDDTMLLSYVLEGAKHGHGMDELSQLYLGHKTITFAEVAGSGKAQVTFDRVALEQARDYAAEDADVTLRFHRVLKPRLVEETMATVYETLERPLVPVLVEMEKTGILVDRDELRALSRDFAARLGTLEIDIYRLAGHEFTVGSPKQLGEVLFDEMGIPGGRKGKTGAYATGADILEQLAAMGHELPARVLDWRQLQKLKSTYADALLGQINPETGRVHTSYAMAITSTGRLSSSDPNLQNIPIRTEEGRKIRRAFVAEKGWRLLSVDYSQIELRLAAHVATVEPLKQAFREGADIHALTASQVFGVPPEKLDPVLRRRAKAINFGIIYGISPFGLAQQLGISNGEAAAYIEAYFKRYPGIRDYMERTKEFCRQHGYVETLFGRRCFIPGINDKNPARRSFGERAAINAPL
ncbi:MAG: DNA polymerase I, partial [Alphaproteobacteria bacterium]